jgi:DNA-binding CsgD family transcriptional regulator
MDVLSRIRLKGIALSIDDFGTGFSSLKLLRRMPFTEIKIDQAFVRDITTSRDSQLIVRSIIDLATNMELGCMAEGVEDAETADLLEQIGARELQGYFIARPMPIESIPAWEGMWTRRNSEIIPNRDPDPSYELPAAVDQTMLATPASVSPPTEAICNSVRLSPRQLDVMRVLAEGRPVKEIARRLNIGIGTVKVHLALAYTALGAHNRVEAIRRAGPDLLSQPAEQP